MLCSLRQLRVQCKQRSRWKFSCFYLTQSKRSWNYNFMIFENPSLFYVIPEWVLSLVLHNPKIWTGVTTSIMLVSRHLTIMIVRKIKFHSWWIILLSTIWFQEIFDLTRLVVDRAGTSPGICNLDFCLRSWDFFLLTQRLIMFEDDF